MQVYTENTLQPGDKYVYSPLPFYEEIGFFTDFISHIYVSEYFAHVLEM